MAPSIEPTSPASQPVVRPSRKYVSRACDWCRVRRIKCDNGQPCKACRIRGEECTTKGLDEPRTLPQALREINKLKLRIRQLESQQSSAQAQAQLPHATLPSPQSLTVPSTPGVSPRSCSSHPSPQQPLSAKPQWEGIYVATARNDQPAYYGPASSFYFVSRLANYLANELQQPLTSSDRNMQLKGASKSMHVGSSLEAQSAVDGLNPSQNGGNHSQALSRSQEEYLIKLFWEGYHCFCPIVDEFEFRNHYASLWEPSRETRNQSPLVDIILALSLQYGFAYLPQHALHPADRDPSSDSSVAGRWYYRRAQYLLTADLENPSITTVQCYIFMTSYLCCASFQNMCHIITAQAVRTAYVLGLHLEPPESLPDGQRELRKRVWWVLWVMEAKISCKLGRPFLVDWTQVTVTPPSDDLKTASYNSVTLGSYGPDVTWLTFSIHHQRLHAVMADIYDSFYTKCGEVMQRAKPTTLYDDPRLLETCAGILDARMPSLQTWIDQIPAQLKMRRRNGGEMYSTDHSAVEFEMLAPVWLQRQRLFLELSYHSVSHNLTRPLVTFGNHQNNDLPLVERYTTASIRHAISYTLVMHQALTETDLLSGWSEFFSIQWNVAITLVSFLLAKASHKESAKAREALEKALVVFDIFGKSFDVSADAAKIMRNLLAKADELALKSQVEVQTSGMAKGGAAMPNPSQEVEGSQNDLAWLDPHQQADDNYYAQIMDWGMLLDSFNSFDDFFDITK